MGGISLHTAIYLNSKTPCSFRKFIKQIFGLMFLNSMLQHFETGEGTENHLLFTMQLHCGRGMQEVRPVSLNTGVALIEQHG